MRKLIYWLASWMGIFIAIIWMVYITGQFVTGYSISFLSFLEQLAGGMVLTYTVLVAIRRPVMGGIGLFLEGFAFVVYCRKAGMLTGPNTLNGLAPMVVALLFLISQRGYQVEVPIPFPEEKENQFKFPE